MKKNHRVVRSTLLLIAASLPVHADLFWDGTDLTADADGGTGVWDTSLSNWDTLDTGGADIVWPSTENAIFGGTAGTVTVADGILANNINLKTNGYTLQGGSLNLGAGVIETGPGVGATLKSVVTGTGGLTKTGPGTLTLSGGNSYTGPTAVVGGTLNIAPNSTAYRYYRFTNSLNHGNGTSSQDGYNQIGALHYYQNGTRIPAVAGSQTGPGTGEQNWANANDDLGSNAPGFTKYGVGTRPYFIQYDFGAGTPVVLDAYNWSSANDSTPARNPRKWIVAGSNDGTNFTTLDNRSLGYQNGPTALYTWSGATGNFQAYVNGGNQGATDAFKLSGAIPAASPLQIAGSATLDLSGFGLVSPSLSNYSGTGGTVTSATPAVLNLGATVAGDGNNPPVPATFSEFSGTLTGAISLAKILNNTQILSGSASNTYTGVTTLGGSGRLVLAKTGGAIAIPGNVNLSATAWSGNASGLVLAGDEQIADTAILTWTTNSAYGVTGATTYSPLAESFLRLNGHTETVAGLVSGTTGTIENRGFLDTGSYGTGTVIINVATGQTHTFTGVMRDIDGGANNGGKVAITKTGPGTQVLGGNMSAATGPLLVNQGVLRLNNTFNSATISVIGSGTLEGSGGNLAGGLTVDSGGIFSPGTAGAGTFSASPTIGSGGALTMAGTVALNGFPVVANGGSAAGVGTINGGLTVQAGGSLAPGTAGIGTLNVNGALNLAGTTTFEVNKAGATLTNDKISNSTTVTYGGALNIVYTGDAPASGDTYQLFPPGVGATFAGGFSSITGLPALDPGLQWRTTSLFTDGSISVIATASPPSASPSGGGYIGAQLVTLAADSGSTIYYTTDGSDPTTSSTVYSGPFAIPVDSVVTVKAFAQTSGFPDSGIATSLYRTVTAPKWNVDADGTWSTATNWLNEVAPNGSGVLVDFTLAKTAPRTVTLDLNRTVGSLVFGSADANLWTLARSASNILTLDVPSGSPVIESQDIGQDVDTVISAVLAGSKGLAKTGNGTLSLTGTNTYSGTTAITGGSITVAALAGNGTSSPLGTGPTMTLDGGILRYTGAGSIGAGGFNRNITLEAGGGTLDTFTGGFYFTTGVISGPGSLTKTGARQLIIQAANTYDGVTNVNEAEVQFRTLTAFGSTAGNTVVANGARVAAGGGIVGTITEDFVLNGTGGNGNGSLQSNDGGTNINYGGTLTLATDSGLGSSTGIAFTVSGAIGGPGGLVKLSNNAVTLAGTASNTYGGTTVLGGTGKLILGKTGGALAIPGDISLSSTAFNGNNSGVVLAGNEQIADTAIVTWTTTSQSGGAQEDSFFRLNGFTETVGGLNSVGNGVKAAVENRGNGDVTAYGTATLILNTLGDYSYNGGIRDMDGGSGGGSIALTKTGPGSQTLSGGLGYTGPTIVDAGTLVLNATAASPVTVETGGTLSGTGGTSGTLDIDAGGTLAPGTSAGTLTAGDTIIDGTYAFEIDGATADRLTVNGNLDIDGATLDVTVLSAPTGSAYVIASYTGTRTGEFTLAGDPLPVGYSVVYNDDAKQVLLVKPSFAAFAAINGLSGDDDADFDNDGLADVVEYVLGSDPKASDGGAPTLALDGGNLVFTFTRDDASLTPDVGVSVEVGTTLLTWPDEYSVGLDTGSSDAGIEVTDNGATDTIKLTVLQAPDDIKFARLKVVVTP